MQVIKHINNQFDCFSGIGYETHTRLQMMNGQEGRSFRYISGQRLPQTVIKQLVELLHPRLHYQKLDI